MIETWVVFFIGAFLGALVTFVMMAILIVGRRADADENRHERTI